MVTTTYLPLVSVIMNCHNSDRYLREAINSVYSQTYPNWEIIFWDNASNDESPGIAKSYDKRLRYFSGDRKVSLYAARNLAISKAKGEFVAFLDCDDLWMKEKLEKQIPLFCDDKVGIVYSDAIYFNNDGREKQLYKTRPFYTGRCFADLLNDYCLCLQTVVVRKKALDLESELFDPRFNIAGDTDLFRRIAYNWKLAMVNAPLARYRIHQNSMNSTQPYLLLDEIQFMIAKYKKIFPAFETEYPREICSLEIEYRVQSALMMLKDGKRRSARKFLTKVAFTSPKVFLLFLLTFFPQTLFLIFWRLRQRIDPLRYY